jgi:hypothetical protein
MLFQGYVWGEFDRVGNGWGIQVSVRMIVIEKWD